MNTAIKSAQEATGLPLADKEHLGSGGFPVRGGRHSGIEDPKAHCMMSGVAYQVHEGKPIVMTRPVNIVITPSHRLTGCNRCADKMVLLEHDVLGHNLLRRPFNLAPPEVQGDHYQLGPKVLGGHLQRRDTAALSWPYTRRISAPRTVPGSRVEGSPSSGSIRTSNGISCCTV